MIAVTGSRTTIVQELAKTERIERIDADLAWADCQFDIPEAERFVLAAGALVGKRIQEQGGSELLQAFSVNLINTVRLVETILDTNARARVVVIGSESAFLGSYDQAYAVAKGGLCAYASWRKVGPEQTLAVLCPPIISDSGMTMRRADYPEILAKRRTVTAAQVADAIKRLLDGPTGFNFVERMC